jgi:hypothetical protein
MTSPGWASIRQARRLGSPLTVIKQSKQIPMPQNTPRGVPPSRVRRQDRWPAAISAAATL